jgi:hypothetical protein
MEIMREASNAGKSPDSIYSNGIWISRRQLLSTAVQAGLLLAARPKLFAQNVEGHQTSARSFSDVLANFENPPHSARPWAYWIWLNGNISAEGITADLEAMRAVGIGGAIVISVGGDTKLGPVHFGTPEWSRLVLHAIAEAQRLGLEIDLNNDDGWDAGGPWITPEHALQKVVWTETSVHGGRNLDLDLPKPHMEKEFYRDIKIIAFPAPVGSIEARVAQEPAITMLSGDPSYVVHDYASPVTARGVHVNAWAPRDSPPVPLVWELQVSDDGHSYRRVYRFDNNWRFTEQKSSKSFPISVGFSAVSGRFFRLVVPFTKVLSDTGHGRFGNPNGGSSGRFNEVYFELLPEPRIDLWEVKGGFINNIPTSLQAPSLYPDGWSDPFQSRISDRDDESPGTDSIIQRQEIVDLTANFNGDRLAWNAPGGDWLILRIGHTPTGSINAAATPCGQGYNVDAMSQKALDFHFANYLEKVACNTPQYLGKTLTYFHSDSWEAGAQNWTSDFANQFAQRRGYTLDPYLPVLAGGRIVENEKVSERFLWDFRRTIADLIAENFWGHLATLCHKHGVKMSGEAAGKQQFLVDPVLFQSQVDVPMGEFWCGEGNVRPDCLVTVSAANALGKPLVFGEAFTSNVACSYPQAGQWRDYPFSLKKLGDRALCVGINRFVFHRCVQQPEPDARPGRAWGNEADAAGIGINMDRTQTWWNQGAAWIKYLSRCQGLLQTGTEVVDFCVLMNPGVPSVLICPEGMPQGYKYNGIETEILSTLTVRDGFLATPQGMKYRILVLPDSETMTPRIAREVARLVDAGAIVVGPMPERSPSLSGYPDCDREVQRVGTIYWKGCRVFSSIPNAITHLSLGPDFEPTTADGVEWCQFIHKQAGDADIYFVANQQDQYANLTCKFRCADRTPELWDPDSGSAIATPVYRSEGSYTAVPIQLEPYGSVFVVFSRFAGESADSGTRNNAALALFGNGLGSQFEGLELTTGSGSEITFNTAQPGRFSIKSSKGRKATFQVQSVPAREIGGPWDVRFAPGWGAPEEVRFTKLISWSNHDVEGVRYFSGSAVYHKQFTVQANEIRPDRGFYLDLGEVAIIAELSMNRRALGVRWKPPFRYDITSAIRPGVNDLAIAITNLWPNRLIGDQWLPPERQFTRTNFNPYERDSPLLPSGLLGPVRLVITTRGVVPWQAD